MIKPAVGIIGTGVVGSAIAIILQRQGYQVAGVSDRDPARSRWLGEQLGVPAMTPSEVVSHSEVVFLTTNDGMIEVVAQELAVKGSFRPGQMVIHMSGALTSEVLCPAAEKGAVCLSVHPLQSFATTERAIEILPGSVFSIEGDTAGYQTAIMLVEDLGGRYFFIDKMAKPLYHAGACVVSNYLVTLIDLGSRLLEAADIPKELSIDSLFPLIEGTLNNIRKVGIPQALTGPIARGDLATIQQHLSTMEEVAPNLVSLYRYLGYQTVKVAEQKGSISQETANQLKQVLH